MSIVSYNGVYLPYPSTTNFDQRAIRDPLGDTDWWCTEFDISVQCVVNAAYINMLIPALAGHTSNPADIMMAVRSRLLEHKKTLSFVVNGVEMIPQKTATDPAGTVDVDNGPKPQHCRIIELNSVTFLVDYRITARYWENNFIDGENDPIVGNNPGGNVVYNRWSETLEIDNLNKSTRVRDGQFRIRSDNLDGFTPGQVIPQMAVLGVPKGWLRQSSRYMINPDGLALSYTVTDKEQYKMPPAPAYEASGEYVEEMSRAGGHRFCECTVRLKGSNPLSNLGPLPPGGGGGAIDNSRDPQLDLIRTAIAVAVGKCTRNARGRGQGITGLAVVEGARLRISLWENEVEFFVRYRIAQVPTSITITEGIGFVGPQGTTINGNGLAAFGTVDTSVPLDDPERVVPYPVRGSATSTLIHAAAYFDPSLRNIVVNQSQGTLGTGAVEPGQGGKLGV